MSKYLDFNGVQHLWAKIKSTFMSIFPESIRAGFIDEGNINASAGGLAVGCVETDEYGVIEADWDGTCALGWVDGNNSTQDPTIGAYSYGAMSQGAADTNAIITSGSSNAAGKGSFARGYAKGYYGEDEEDDGVARIEASAAGAFASGAVEVNSTDDASIRATGKGSYAGGYTTDGDNIIAVGNGSFAHGYMSVTASGVGSHAEGTGTGASGDYSVIDFKTG